MRGVGVQQQHSSDSGHNQLSVSLKLVLSLFFVLQLVLFVGGGTSVDRYLLIYIQYGLRLLSRSGWGRRDGRGASAGRRVGIGGISEVGAVRFII